MKKNKARKPSAKKNVGGRPNEPKERLRDFRANLLLDDKEEAVFKKALDEISEREGRKVTGAELLRRLNTGYIRRQAERYGMELNPPKPTDLIPVSEVAAIHEIKSGRMSTTPSRANAPRVGTSRGAGLEPSIEPEDLDHDHDLDRPNSYANE